MIQQLGYHPGIDAGGLEQGIASCPAQFGNQAINPQARALKDNLAGQGITVAVQAGAAQTHHQIPHTDPLAGEQAFALGHRHAKAGQIVIAIAIYFGENGGFTAHQGTAGLDAAIAHAAHQGLDQRGVVFGDGNVIEKKQRLGARAQAVVDRHGHQVDPNGVVAIHHRRHLQFGADAI